MDCPRCGFVLDPFATECPRCAHLKAQSPASSPARRADRTLRKECPFCGLLLDPFEEICPKCTMTDYAPPIIPHPYDEPSPKAPRKLCPFCDSLLDELTQECPQCSTTRWG